MEEGLVRNPWLDLGREAPFVLTEDSPAIDRFNKRATDATRIHLDLIPEPFLGNPAAPVVFLALNPGFSDDDAHCHSDATFAELSRDNLKHLPSDYPFYLLNPRVDGPGRCYWDQRLGHILRTIPRQVVASRLLCVEYFGYHSKKFAHQRLRLPSQEYGFFLAGQAVRRESVIIVTRGRQLWLEAVPELNGYAHLFNLHSSQNTTITLRNCPDGFERIIGLLKQGDSDCATRGRT